MKVIEKVDRSFWEDVAHNCPYATFFHTPYWAELMSKTFAYRDVTKGFIFEDGTRAVFPMMKQKRNLLKGGLSDYVSGPPYTYGGAISDKALSGRQLNEIFEYIISDFKYYNIILIRGNPFDHPANPAGFKEIKDSSHIVELSHSKSENDLFKMYFPTSRNVIYKAMKGGLLVKAGATMDEYEQLYKIYKKTVAYWKQDLTDYPFLMFQTLYRMKCDQVKLWSVYTQNTMIGGKVTLVWNNVSIDFIAYYDRDYSKLESRRYLLHTIYLDCLEKGIGYFDFRQSGGIKSLEDFKRSMGGIEYPHSAWLKHNNFLNGLRKFKSFLTSPERRFH